MSVAFYMDQHIHGAVVRGLRQRGIDCLTAEEDGNADLDDEPLLERATSLGRCFVTQDADFFAIAERFWAANREFAGIVYSEQMRITIGQMIRDLELIATVLEPAETRSVLHRIPM